MSLTSSAHTFARRRTVPGYVDRGNDKRARAIERRWSASARAIERGVEGEAPTNEFKIRDTIAVAATR